MPTDPHVLERRHAARRTEIVDRLLPIVEELLDRETSYLDLSVEQIIQRVGMARSTFYRYFADKHELLLAVSEPALAQIVAASQLPWSLPPAATRADLALTMQEVFDTYHPHITLMNAMVEVSAYDATVEAQFRAGFVTAQRSIAAHIRTGQRAGFIRPDLDPDETAGWLTWMAERGMPQLVAGARRGPLRRLVASFTAILWYTLYEGQGRAER